MPTPGYMFHKNRPEGQLFPDLPTVQATLEGEGWVDTPRKLPDYALNNPGNVMTPAKTTPTAAAAMAASDGRVLSTDPLTPAAPDPHATARYDQLFDKDDGTSISDALEDEDFVRVIDDMSREEVSAALTHLGAQGDNNPDTLASHMRSQLVDLLRPDFDMSGINFGESRENQTAPASDDTSRTEPGAPADPESRTEAEQQQASDTSSGQDRIFKPMTDVLQGKIDDLTETEQPEVADVTTEQLQAMSKDDREAWLGRATKADLTAKLDALEVPYKARDGKEELQEALRAKLNAEPTGE